MRNGLTLRQKRFVAAITSEGCKSATQAAAVAGYAKACQSEAACENLRKPYVRAAIEEEQKRIEAKADVRKVEWFRRCVAWARANILDFATVKGNTVTIKDLTTVPPELIGAIESIKQTKDGVELKLISKHSLIEDIRRMAGLDAPTRLRGEEGRPSSVLIIHMPTERESEPQDAIAPPQAALPPAEHVTPGE